MTLNVINQDGKTRFRVQGEFKGKPIDSGPTITAIAALYMKLIEREDPLNPHSQSAVVTLRNQQEAITRSVREEEMRIRADRAAREMLRGHR